MNLEQYDSHLAVTDWLLQRDQPVAITLTETLEPVGGPGAVVFPPTYARDEKQRAKSGMDHPYPISTLRPDVAPEAAAAQGLEANLCDLDTVGAQANRMEPVFTRPPLSSLVPQRVIKAGATAVNLLEIAHRIADGAVRFSALGDEVTQALAALGRERNAATLARLAPTSLVFGFWNSREKADPQLAIKFPRVLSAAIRATNVAVLKRSAQFNPAFDPSFLGLESALEDAEESVETKQKHWLAKLGLRSVPAVDTHGGVRVFGKITRQTEINLVALRGVAVVTGGALDAKETLKLRRYLLGLSLVAGRFQSGYHLRQGCLLVPTSAPAPVVQLVLPSGQRTTFTWEFAASFAFARAAAQDFGVWSEPAVAVEFAFQPEKVKAARKAMADKPSTKAKQPPAE